MKNILPIFLIGTLLLVLPACGKSSSDLVGQTWHLVSFGSPSSPSPAAAGISTQLTFDSNGTMDANMGCNAISGDYTLSNGSISFGPVISTMMACMDNGSDKQERALVSAFNNSVNYQIDGDTLTITTQDGQITLIFTNK